MHYGHRAWVLAWLVVALYTLSAWTLDLIHTQRHECIDFSMLEVIITLAQIFRDQQKQLYMVGGTVRDVLLNRGQSADADLATDARPDEIKRLVAPTRPTAAVLVGERFGTVRLRYD